MYAHISVEFKAKPRRIVMPFSVSLTYRKVSDETDDAFPLLGCKLRLFHCFYLVILTSET